MDKEALAEARGRAQEAQSAARLTDDPFAKEQWEQLARRWRARITKLEGDEAVSPVVAPITSDTDMPPLS